VNAELALLRLRTLIAIPWAIVIGTLASAAMAGDTAAIWRTAVVAAVSTAGFVAWHRFDARRIGTQHATRDPIEH
jgi:hypothetical protein